MHIQTYFVACANRNNTFWSRTLPLPVKSAISSLLYDDKNSGAGMEKVRSRYGPGIGKTILFCFSDMVRHTAPINQPKIKIHR